MRPPSKKSPEQQLREVRKLLTFGLPHPMELDTKMYHRIHDDNDGTGEGILQILIRPDGDMCVETTKTQDHAMLRFRTSFGGGNSVMVRNALLLVALAIKWEEDNEEKRRKK